MTTTSIIILSISILVIFSLILFMAFIAHKTLPYVEGFKDMNKPISIPYPTPIADKIHSYINSLKQQGIYVNMEKSHLYQNVIDKTLYTYIPYTVNKRGRYKNIPKHMKTYYSFKFDAAEEEKQKEEDFKIQNGINLMV